MKKGTIRLIPLQADLCLNKQKVDIEDFKGWNKCNAPVYGNCLSPLYKAEEEHHDFFIGDDKYDWIDGVLYKNDVAVLSGVGAKKIKKTELTSDYSALAVSEDDTLTWLKELSGTEIEYSLYGGTATDVTLTNCQRIIKTKAFANDTNSIYGIVVLFLRTDGAYGYYLAWSDNGTVSAAYGEGGEPTRWNGFNVVSPLIQVGVLGTGKFLVSVFGTSGADIGSTEVKNIYVQSGNIYDNPTFYDGTLYPTRYEVRSGSSDVKVIVNTICARSSLYNSGVPTKNKVNFGQKQRITIFVKPHKLPLEVTLVSKDPDNPRDLETFRFEPSEIEIQYQRTVSYWDYVNQSDQYASSCRNRYELYIGNSSLGTTLVSFSRYGTGIIETDSSDYSKASTILHVPAYLRQTYSPTGIPPIQDADVNICCRLKYWTLTDANANDTSIAPDYKTVEITYGGYNKTGLIVYNYCHDTTAGLPIDLNTMWDNSTAMDYLSFAHDYDTVGDAYPYGQGFNPLYCGKILYTSESSGPYVAIAPSWYNKNTYAPINGPDSGRFNFGSGSQAFSYRYKVQYTEQSLKEVDCCMDDGYLYNVGAISNNENVALPTKRFALAGEFGSFDTSTKKISYTSTATFDIAYNMDDANIFPKYFKGMNISLGNNYLRITYLFKAKQTDKEYINILIDSLAVAEGKPPAHLYSGVQSGTGGNLQGGVTNTTDTEGFRLLFNNNLISNIACYEKKEYIGTILADWFTVDGEFCPAFNSHALYYKDNNNHLWKIEIVTSGNEWDYRLIENRFVVLNTTNYFNCYDTKTGLKRHWASDYNNRVLYGKEFTSFSNNDTFGKLLTSTLFSGLIITSQNANYEETKDSITGIELGAILYSRVILEYTFVSCGVPYGAVEGIDLYRGDGNSTAALYICSFQNGMKYIDNDLVNPFAVYPIAQNGDVRYNPNLFTRFISSYNNKDMVISDGIAYKLVYFNNVIPIMAYYLLDGVEELKDAFVLQSSYYGVSETRLYQMNYSNGVGVEVVCDITNMEYLGALPTQALFWSAQNRAIYSFKGNCIMSLSQYANDLEVIKKKWYNPATQELFLDTNIGLLVFSDLGTYCLPRFTVTQTVDEEEVEVETDIKDIFFYPDMFIINLEDDNTTSYYWSYNPLEDYESNKIHFVTKYYGNGKVPITVNNIYIRLYNQGVADAEGIIKFKGHTVTDIGVQTDEKTVTIGGTEGESWDAETDTMLVKYTPQYTMGLGFALEVITTFPIIDIKYDYVENGTVEGQLGHINI